MRQIKFRGLCTHTGQWVFGSLIQSEEGTFIHPGGYSVLFAEPDYHKSGMGCGLEDKGILDRYEAMEHGWQKAVDKISSDYPEYIEVDAKTIGQLSGSNDKKGVEIYEGDILQIHNSEEDESMGPKYHYRAVEWNGGCLKIEWDFIDFDMTAIGWAIEHFGHDITVQVVGNVHEHAELLNPSK